MIMKKIAYAKDIATMNDDMHYILRKTCEISTLPENIQQELYTKTLEIWFILMHNQNLTEEYKCKV